MRSPFLSIKKNHTIINCLNKMLSEYQGIFPINNTNSKILGFRHI